MGESPLLIVFDRKMTHLACLTKNIVIMTGYKILDRLHERGTCLECGETYYGRPNQKFCSETCKNRFNNKKAQDIRNTKLRINTILERNYAILSSLIKENRYSISLFDLSAMGYKIDYMTFNCKLNRHDQCGCYDISYIRAPTRIYNIRRVKYDKSYIFVP